MKDLTYEERLRKLKLPSLRYRRLRGDMIETFNVFQTLLAYSRIGLTSDLNSKQNVLKSKYLNDLLIIPTIWFALITCVWICFSKLSFEKWSEKWLLRFHPDKCKVLSIIGKRHQQRTTEYTMPTYSGSYVTLESVESERHWSYNRLKAVSSANMYTSDSTFSGKSLINITNNTGPSTEPCGIPLVTLCHFDTDPFSCTLCLRLLRKFFKWSEKWLLRFHPDKCKVLSIIGKRHQQRTTKYTMPTYSGSHVTLESLKEVVDIILDYFNVTLIGNIPV
jgi:hypothetical protein